MGILTTLNRSDYEFSKLLQANAEHASKLFMLDAIISEAQERGQDLIVFDGNPYPEQTVHFQVVDFWQGQGAWTTSGYDYQLTVRQDPTRTNYRIIEQINLG